MAQETVIAASKIIPIIVGVLAILGFFAPMILSSLFWKMKEKWAMKDDVTLQMSQLRSSMRGAVKRLRRENLERAERFEKDIARMELTIMKAIQESRESTRHDINELGKKWTATHKVAEAAIDIADDAKHQTEKTQQALISIDEHGTKVVRELEKALHELKLELQRHHSHIKEN